MLFPTLKMNFQKLPCPPLLVGGINPCGKYSYDEGKPNPRVLTRLQVDVHHSDVNQTIIMDGAAKTMTLMRSTNLSIGLVSFYLFGVLSYGLCCQKRAGS